MSKFNFGEVSPGQLKRGIENAAQKRAENRETSLKKGMKGYLEPFEQMKTDLAEEREKYEKEPSSKKLEALAQSILENYKKKGEKKTKREIQAETLNEKSFFRYMRENHSLEKILKESNQKLAQTLIEARPDSDVFESTSFKEKIDEWRQFNRKISNILEKELPNKNPESFMTHSLLKLRKYKEELKTGIVETETVQKRKEEIIDKLTNNGLVALVGETGTGKTKIAIKIADELSEGKGYEFAMGHEKITKEDLLYYLGIEPQTIKAEDAPQLVETAQERYLKLHPGLTSEQKKEQLKWIEEVVLGQAKEKALETKIVLGPVLKAAKEGKVVVIDEFNFIPPEALAMLNTFVEAKPGDTLKVMGEDIKVQKGFGVILTGNISKGEVSRYLKRQELDPAFINRLNSGLLRYGTLPQEYDRVLQKSIIKQKEFREGKEPPKRELFEIGLAHLADEKGNIKAPKNALGKLWRLSQEFSILQKIFAKEPLREESITSDSGTRFNLQKYHASMRTFGAILEDWKNDAFKQPLDWYIYDNLIRPSSIITPTESAQMFYILKTHGGFFKGKEWDNLKVDSRDWKFSGLEKEADKTKDDFRQEVELKYFSPQEIAEATSGIRMPEPGTKIKGKERVAKQEEIMETYKELDKEVREVEKVVEGRKESINLFCEDEGNIKNITKEGN